MTPSPNLPEALERVEHKLRRWPDPAPDHCYAQVGINDLRALVAAVRGREWRPIETAPKGMSDAPYLCWGADSGFFVVIRPWGLVAAEEPEGTHWQPLASPPDPQPSPETKT